MHHSYDAFVESLGLSQVIALEIAGWLAERGYNCRYKPGTVTPNPESRMEHVDFGDLEVIKRLEVKHWPNIDFQSLDDIGYENIIVDETYKLKKYHKNTLYSYMIVNASRTGALWIDTRTREHWYEDELPDKNNPGTRNFTLVPKKYAIYLRLR